LGLLRVPRLNVNKTIGIKTDIIILINWGDFLKYKVIREEKQRNPIIVTKYNRGYLVLDSAHRYTALKKIGCQYVMCQVVEKDDYTIEIWNHQISHNDFLKISPNV
jgi:hypothetical protein